MIIAENNVYNDRLQKPLPPPTSLSSRVDIEKPWCICIEKQASRPKGISYRLEGYCPDTGKPVKTLLGVLTGSEIVVWEKHFSYPVKGSHRLTEDVKKALAYLGAALKRDGSYAKRRDMSNIQRSKRNLQLVLNLPSLRNISIKDITNTGAMLYDRLPPRKRHPLQRKIY
jgi:hypothetical protein